VIFIEKFAVLCEFQMVKWKFFASLVKKHGEESNLETRERIIN
jgi:hypothetical protein